MKSPYLKVQETHFSNDCYEMSSAILGQTPVLIKHYFGNGFYNFDRIADVFKSLNAKQQKGIPQLLEYSASEKVFVFQHIAIDTLNNYINYYSLSFSELLDLMVDLCEMVEAFHHNGYLFNNLHLNQLAIELQTNKLVLIDIDSLSIICDEENDTLTRKGLLDDILAVGGLIRSLLKAAEIEVTEETNSLNIIINKACASDTESRYQNSTSLYKDIQRCRDDYKKLGKTPAFKLAKSNGNNSLSYSAKLYGRDEECKEILRALNRSYSGKGEIVFLSGSKKTGKSYLVKQTLAPNLESSFHLLFDAQPSVTDCLSVTSLIKSISNQLMTHLNVDQADFLRQVFGDKKCDDGSLKALLFADDSSCTDEDYLAETLNQLLSYPQHKVIILNHLHRFDGRSLAVLNSLFENLKAHNLLCIFCFPSDSVLDDSLFLLKRTIVAASNIYNSTDIELKPLEQNTITQFIGDSISLRDQDLHSLSDKVFEKVNGSIYFARQYLKYLIDEQIITNDTVTRRWKVDFHSLNCCRFEPFLEEFKYLKRSYQYEQVTALNILVSLGRCFPKTALTFVTDLEPKPGLVENVTRTLVLNGMLLDQQSSYVFGSQDLHVAMLHEISNDEREPIHKVIFDGYMALGRDLEDIEYINCYWHIVELWEHCAQYSIKIKDYIYLAQKCIAIFEERKEFKDALKVSQNLIATLGNNPWESHYQVCLETHKAAAKFSNKVANYDLLKSFADEIIAHSKDEHDELEAVEYIIQAAKSKNTKKEAVEYGLNALAKHGIRYPENPGLHHQLKAVLGIVLKVAFFNHKRIIEKPEMKDKKARGILRLMAALAPAIYIASDKHLPLLIKTGFDYSTKYGNTGESAIAYSGIGLILRYLGSIKYSNIYDQIGQDVLQKYQAWHYESRLMFFSWSFIKPWISDLRETEKPLLEAHRKGLEYKDYEYASYASSGYHYNCFLAGKNIPVLLNEVASATREISGYNNETPIHLHKLLWQTLHNLVGASDTPYCLDGEIYNQAAHEEIITSGSDVNVSFAYYYLNLMLFTLFSLNDDALEMAEYCDKHIGGVRGFPVIPSYQLFAGVTCCRVHKGLKGVQKLKNKLKIKRYLMSLKRHAKHAPENFQAHYWLLLASREAYLGKGNGELFLNAINIAKGNNNSVHAFANELYAQWLLRTGSTDKAYRYYSEACNGYETWGALAKKKQLEFRVQHLQKNTASKASNEIDAGLISKILSASTFDVSSRFLLEEVIRVSQCERAWVIFSNEQDYNGYSLDMFSDELAVLSDDDTTPKGIKVMCDLSFEKARAISFTHALDQETDIEDFIKDNMVTKVDVLPFDYNEYKVAILMQYSRDESEKVYEDVPKYEALTQLLIERLKQFDLEKSKTELTANYQALYDNAQLGVFNFCDVRGFSMNQALCNMFGYKNEPQFLAHVHNIKAQLWENREDANKLLERLIEFGRVDDYVIRFCRNDGSRFYGSVNAAAAVDNNRIVHACATIIDVTDIHKTELAENAMKEKSRFLSYVAHEINNPVQAVMTLTDMIRPDLPNSNLIDKKKRLYSEINDIKRLVDDLLLHERIGLGNFEFKAENVNLHRTFIDAIDLLTSKAKRKGISIQSSGLSRLPMWITGDSLRLKEILMTIVNRSINTPKTYEIAIDFESSKIYDDRHLLQVSIRDNGQHLDKDRAKNLFMPFDEQTNRELEHGGIGLTLAKELIELMGGQISVESDAKNGTHIEFDVLLGAGTEIRTPSNKLMKLDQNANLTLLYADEDGGVQHLVSEVLENQAGISKLYLANSSKETLNLIHDHDDIDVMLIDYQMSGMSINEVIERVRLIKGPSFPVIALRSEGQSSTHNGGKSIFSLELRKPVSSGDLIDKLAKLTGKIAQDTQESGFSSILNSYKVVDFTLPTKDYDIGILELKSHILTFLSDASQIEELESLWLKGDTFGAYKVVHELGSRSQMIGAATLWETVEDLKRQLKAGMIEPELLQKIRDMVGVACNECHLQLEHFSNVKDSIGLN
ncbi:MAG: ATP-binding protein [Pseudomonadales bacterium]|nr:ATP-binding protein [Pseudomonadales bacterium]